MQSYQNAMTDEKVRNREKGSSLYHITTAFILQIAKTALSLFIAIRNFSLIHLFGV